MNLDKVIISFIDQKLRRVDNKLDDEVDFVNSASADGVREFSAFASYRVETAKLSELQKDYRKYFRDMLKQFGAIDPSDLTDKQRSEFFKAVKDNWIIGVGPVEEENDE